MGSVKEIGDSLISSVKQYVSDAFASVSKRLDEFDARIKAIPAGADGKNGAPGDRGPEGEKGAPGDQGQPGEKGDKGEPGSPGKDGERGEHGLRGPEGERGKDGVDGATGRDGAPGKDGERGEIGLPGKDADPAVMAAMVDQSFDRFADTFAKGLE